MNRHSSKEAPTRTREPGNGAPGGSKRERILEAAVKVFADKGFFNAKVSEIAREAGVADGTIYLYFKSKDDLLISLFEDRMAVINANVRRALESETEPVAKLRAAIHLHLGLVAEHPDLAEVLTVELRQSAKFMKEYAPTTFGEFLKLLASAIEDGQRAGVLRADLEAPVIARALFGALDELALAWLLRRRGPGARKGEGADLGHAAGQLADLFIDGLRLPAEASSPTTRNDATRDEVARPERGAASRRTP